MHAVYNLKLYRIQVLNTGHNPNAHFPSFMWRIRAWIQGSAEPLANLLNLCFQLISLKEDDEDSLVHIVSLNFKIFHFSVFLISFCPCPYLEYK